MNLSNFFIAVAILVLLPYLIQATYVVLILCGLFVGSIFTALASGSKALLRAFK